MHQVRFRAVILPLLSCLSLPVLAASGDPQSLSHLFRSETSATGVALHFDVPPVSWLEQSGLSIPMLEGAGEAGVSGAPMLPVYNRMIPVPAGMDLVLEDFSAEWEQLGSFTIQHDLGQEDNSPRDEAAYTRVAEESWTPVEVGATGRWRDIRFAPVVIRPMRYDPSSGETECATTMSISFRFEPSSAPDGYDPPGVSEALLPLYNSFIPGALDDLDPTTVRRGTYLMIVPATFMEAVEPLIQWRTRQGFHVDVVERSTLPTGANTIWTWLNEYYQGSDPPLDYVVFIGDVDAPANIPTFFISPGSPFPIDPSIATDHKYTYDFPAGNQFENVLPRYLIGRISVDTAVEARTVVNKIINYERHPLLGNTSRWTRAVTIADASFAISTQQTQNWVRDKLLDNGFTNVQQIVRTQFNDPGAEAVLSAINNNVSWVSYRGFGSHSSWSGPYVLNSHVATGMTNTNNLPVITSMVCGGGAFDELGTDPCFGELWLRLGSPTNPRGAVAFIAPSEIDTHTRWNNMILAGWYHAMFDQGLRTTGQCLTSAKIQLYNNYPTMWNPNGSNQNSVWFYFHTYNILGDPALQLRAETPRSFEVSHPAELAASSTHFQVTVLDDSNLPVPEAYVVLTEDESVILGVARTNAAGIAHVMLTEQPGEGVIELTVTRPEFIPYLAELSGTGNRGLLLTSLEGIEDASDFATNNNGELNPGELILPEAGFQVVEPGGLENVLLTVSLPSGGGEVTVASQSFGNVAENDMLTLSLPRIRLTTDLENGTHLPVIITLQSATRQQTHMELFQPIQAPDIVIDALEFEGAWMPGDTTILQVRVSNLHPSLGAGEVTAELVLSDSRVTVLDSVGSWSSLPGGAEEVLSEEGFLLAVDPNTYPGRTVDATLTFTTTQGYQLHRNLTVEVGGASPETPTGPVGPGYYMYEDVDIGYDYLPDYEWETINGLPGTQNLGLSDMGNNQDITVQVNLPFSFPYWDDTFTQISVCSNGWLAFGETDLFFFRNRPIPGPLTPNGGLCVFWDDLMLNGSNSGVYARHDTENGWYTVEWRNVRHYNASMSPLNFQVRLFDPAVHDAPGGLGMFAFIYEDIQNMDASENYATVGIISPDGTEGMQVEFANVPAPTASGVVSGRRMLFAARNGGDLTPPDLQLLTQPIQLNAQAGGQAGAHLRVANNGGRSARIHVIGEGISADWGVGGGLDDLGGPDASGYRWYDSREPYGPEYDWVDNVEPENLVPLSGGGSEGTAAVSDEINLPFDISFYGVTYSSFWVCEAGYVTFVHPGVNGSSVNTELPRTFSPRAAIFGFWDNLSTGAAGGVYLTLEDDRAVITYSQLLHLSGGGQNGPYTFQIILNVDGAIHVQYAEMNPRLDSATIGIQNGFGNVGLQVAANASTVNFVEDDLALRFAPGLPWLSIAPAEAAVPGNGTTVIELNAQSNGLPSGLYSGRLLVRSTLAEQYFSLPIEFFISDGPVGDKPRIRVDQLPGQIIPEGGSFSPLSLFPYAEDWDNTPGELAWHAYDHDGLEVVIDDEHQLHVTPLAGWSGAGEMVLRVTDPRLNHDDTRVTFQVGEGNNPPRFVEVSPHSVGRILPGTRLTFSVNVEDDEDHPVELRWYHGGSQIGSDTSVEVDFSWLGADTVRVIAEDSEGAVTNLFWSALVTSTSLEDDETILPTAFALQTLYPNPFNASMKMRYALPRTADVEVRIFNLLGREVAHRHLSAQPAGRHEITFNASSWASGLYFIRWQAGGVTAVKKAVLMK